MTVGAMIQTRELDNPVVEEPPVTGRTSLLRLGGLVAVLAAIGVMSWPVLVFIFVLVFSVVLHELGHFLLARKGGMRVTEFFVGFGPRIWSTKRGETEYGVKAILAGGYVRTPGFTNLEDDIPPEFESRTFRAQSYGRRARMILAGPLTNVLLALLAFFALYGFYNEKIDSNPKTGSPILEVASEANGVIPGPATEAGLQTDDRLVSIDGHSFATVDEIRTYIRERPGKAILLGIIRDSSMVQVPVTLATSNPNTNVAVGYLGVGFHGPITDVSRNPLQAAGRGLQEVGRETKATVSGIGRIFSPSGVKRLWDTVTGQRKDDPTARASSVVGIGKESTAIFRSGLANSLFLFGALNLALGLFNLLPIIPFDGGHFVIATYERLRSRKSKPYRVDFAKVVPFFAPAIVLVAFVVISSFLLDVKR
jgi:membrane-associated protease RseP (regulator of RpoE activity)